MYRRFLFRAEFIFVALSVGPQAIGVLPGLGWFGNWYYGAWPKTAAWLGRAVLRIGSPIVVSGSSGGDGVTDWIQLGFILALAVVGAALWAALDRTQRYDGFLRELMRIGLRYTLGLTLLNYGISKVLHLQMTAPGSYRLLETYGESSPMGLLWTFVGQSAVYSAFAGGMEMLGGFLLFFRRTATLGALIVAAVMFNVVMMDLCFDVPVKLYSSSLVVFSLLLIAPDARWLISVFLLHRPTEAPLLAAPQWTQRFGRLSHCLVKAALIGWILFAGPGSRIPLWERRRQGLQADPLEGIYLVQSFAGGAGPRWSKVGIDRAGWITVVFTDGSRRVYEMEKLRPNTLALHLRDPIPATAIFGVRPAVASSAPATEVFSYDIDARNNLILSGKIGDRDAVTIELRRSDDEMRLEHRGFHLISEQPYNP